MCASEAQIAANRRNAARSTGPRTERGRGISCMNALKHGMASRRDTVPGEDPRELEQRLEGWVDTLGPDDPVEMHLVQTAVKSSWKVERAERAQATRVRSQFETFAQRELNDLAGLGARLFHDCAGATPLYGTQRFDHRGARTSWSGIADDPDAPARLIRQIESTAAGVNWLLGEWTTLRTQLEPGKAWQAHDQFKCIRLLGCQPLDALSVRSVADVFVAAWALETRGCDDAYRPLKGELDDGEHQYFVKMARERWAHTLHPGNPEEARRVLVSIVDGAIEDLKAKAAAFLENAERDAIRLADRLACDVSPEAERLRRYELSASRTMFRSLSELSKLRRDKERAASRKDEAGRMEDEDMSSAALLIDSDRTPIDPGVATDLRGAAGNGDTTPPDGPDMDTACDSADDPHEWRNLDIEADSRDGHLARQEFVRPADADGSSSFDAGDDVRNLDKEPNFDPEDRHLAHQQPALPADPDESSSLAQGRACEIATRNPIWGTGILPVSNLLIRRTGILLVKDLSIQGTDILPVTSLSPDRSWRAR